MPKAKCLAPLGILADRASTRGVRAAISRPLCSHDHQGRATTAPTPPVLLRAFSQEPVGPTRYMVVRPLSILGNTRLDFARTCGHTY